MLRGSLGAMEGLESEGREIIQETGHRLSGSQQREALPRLGGHRGSWSRREPWRTGEAEGASQGAAGILGPVKSSGSVGLGRARRLGVGGAGGAAGGAGAAAAALPRRSAPRLAAPLRSPPPSPAPAPSPSPAAAPAPGPAPLSSARLGSQQRGGSAAPAAAAAPCRGPAGSACSPCCWAAPRPGAQVSGAERGGAGPGSSGTADPALRFPGAGGGGGCQRCRGGCTGQGGG